MCEHLAVSPAGYYAWRTRPRSAHAIADERRLLNVRVAFRKSRRRDGLPRVHQELRDDGIRVGKKRVARFMREGGLVARRRNRRVRTTDSARASHCAQHARSAVHSAGFILSPDRSKLIVANDRKAIRPTGQRGDDRRLGAPCAAAECRFLIMS